jgi:non-heme chloroperoxidase
MPYLTLRDAAQLYYKDWGNKHGPAVFFSHGWPLNADNWDAQMFFLANKGYRCIAHDRRGHGRSEQTWEGNDVDTWADDIAELVNNLHLKELTMVGHSTGGSDIVRYITRRKCCRPHVLSFSSLSPSHLSHVWHIDGHKHVSKLVLISTVIPCLIKTDKTPNGVGMEVLDAFHAAIAKDRGAFFREVPSGPFFGFNRPNTKLSESWVESWFQAGMQASIKATYDTVTSWENYYGDEFAKIDLPVLLLQGDDDQVVPIQTGVLEAIKLAKKGTLKVYPGASHALPNMNADEVNEDILNFIRA